MAELRWDCEKQGCRVKTAHPMMHDFDGPFGTNPPRKIQCMDIDCTVEVDGAFLFVEFKSHYEMSDAQRHYYERLTRLKGSGLSRDTVTVFYVVGDANKRVCDSVKVCANGEWGEWQRMTWAELVDMVQNFKSAARDRFIARREAKVAA